LNRRDLAKNLNALAIMGAIDPGSQYALASNKNQLSKPGVNHTELRSGRFTSLKPSACGGYVSSKRLLDIASRSDARTKKYNFVIVVAGRDIIRQSPQAKLWGKPVQQWKGEKHR
jgi:hypothetical protein